MIEQTINQHQRVLSQSRGPIHTLLRYEFRLAEGAKG